MHLKVALQARDTSSCWPASTVPLACVVHVAFTMDIAPRASNQQPPNRGPAVFAVTTATLILSSVFVGARIFCRHFIVRNLSWDDKVMILAWLFAFFLSFTIDLGTVNGLGKYDADISAQDLSTLRHCEYVFSILYVSRPATRPRPPAEAAEAPETHRGPSSDTKLVWLRRIPPSWPPRPAS